MNPSPVSRSPTPTLINYSKPLPRINTRLHALRDLEGYQEGPAEHNEPNARGTAERGWRTRHDTSTTAPLWAEAGQPEKHQGSSPRQLQHHQASDVANRQWPQHGGKGPKEPVSSQLAEEVIRTRNAVRTSTAMCMFTLDFSTPSGQGDRVRRSPKP